MKNYTKNKRRTYKNIWIEQELDNKATM